MDWVYLSMWLIFFPNYLGDPISDCALNRGTSVTFSCQPLILAVSRANAGWSIFWKFTLAFSSLLQEFQFAFFRKLNSLAYLLNLDVYIWIEFVWYVLLEIEFVKSVISWSFHDRFENSWSFQKCLSLIIDSVQTFQFNLQLFGISLIFH